MPATRSDLVPAFAQMLRARPGLGALLLAACATVVSAQTESLSVNRPTRTGLSEIDPGSASGQLAPDVPAAISVTVAPRAIAMGRSVTVRATARRGDGTAAVGYELLPFANGRRWGAHEQTDANGEAVFHIPLPRPGPAEIRVGAVVAPAKPDDFWIWHGPQNVPGPVWLQKTFTLSAEPQSGSLWVAADDVATVYLNGTQLTHKGGWKYNAPIALGAGAFRHGVNLLSVQVTNGAGPSGLLLRLTVNTRAGATTIVSDQSWVGFAAAPLGWPEAEAPSGTPVNVVAAADKGAARPLPWPSIAGCERLAGTPLDPNMIVSAPIRVEVEERTLLRPPADPTRVVAVQWEEWFTPANAYWQTAQAVPLMGFYDSSLPDVARQHLIWLSESGVDCLIADWSNNIWFADTWAPGPGVMELIEATRVMMDEMVRMRAEGQPVPRMTFLTGVSHVRPHGPQAVNGQLAYIWDHFAAHPQYRGLWQQFEGKPLVLALDISASYWNEGFRLDDRFTVRFVGAQQDINRLNERGLWSWMDFRRPAPTRRGNAVEALTVSVGSFGAGGWLGKDARGRRNGATLIEDWQVALRERPQFLQVHQFQEFAGQLEGQPAAPPNAYYDVYSPELSDDIEPTSLTAHAYRGQGGWGFYYLNLLRALVDLYHQPVPETTVVAIAQPLQREVVRTDSLEVQWVEVGRPATGYTLWANDRVIAGDVKEHRAQVELHALPDGPVTLRLVAEGTRANYRLDWTQDSARLAVPEPAAMEVSFVLARARPPEGTQP